MKLNVKDGALASGLVWGVGLSFLTWWMIAFGGPAGGPTLMGHLYRSFNLNPMGSVIGLVWAFLDGTAGGAIFAWLYNTVAESTQKSRA